MNFDLTKIDTYIESKISKKDFKYLLIIAFIIPIFLFYDSITQNVLETKNYHQKIIKEQKAEQILNIKINNLQLINATLKSQIQKIQKQINKLKSFEKKLFNLKKELSIFKLNNSDWVNITNTLVRFIKNQGYKIKEINVYMVGQNNKIIKKKGKEQNGIKEFVKLVNYKISDKLRLLKPKFYIYMDIQGNNFKNFLELIKEIENTNKIKYIYLIKKNQKDNNYKVLIIYMTIKVSSKG